MNALALRSVVQAYVGLMFAYGTVNFVQDAWNEQLFKRGWTETSIPSAILPSLTPIWLVVVLLGVVCAWTAWQRVCASARLRVGQLGARGSHRLSEGPVREAFGAAVAGLLLAAVVHVHTARLPPAP